MIFPRSGKVAGVCAVVSRLAKQVFGLCAVLVLVSMCVWGQSNPNLESGTHNFGSYHGGDIDTVNLVHGGVDFHIPIIAYPQRGGFGSVEHFFQNSGKKWGVQQIALPAAGGGVNLIYPWTAHAFTQVAGLDFIENSGSVVVGRARQVTYTGPESADVASETDIDYWVGLPDGSVHNLNFISSSGTSTVYASTDTSGFQFKLIAGSNPDHIDDSGVLTDRHGTHYYYAQLGVLANNTVAITGQWLRGGNFVGEPTFAAGDPLTTVKQYNDVAWPASIVDANGNTLSPGIGVSPGPDTLGRAVLGPPGTWQTITPSSDYSGCSSSMAITAASLLSFPGINGGSYTVKVCYALKTVATAFSQPAGTPKTQQAPSNYMHGQWMVVASIVLPDQSHWSMDYDSYGNITSIVNPAGGRISYQWTEIALGGCNDGVFTPVSRAVSSRTVSDGVSSQTWQYSWGQRQSDGTLTNIVTDPLGNDTAHVMGPQSGVTCAYYETETRYYQGTRTNGTLLRTVDTAYSSNQDGLHFVADNVVPTTITTTLANGKVNRVTRQYDPGIAGTFGNVTLETVTDWGQGAPGFVLKQTATTYQWQQDANYLNAGLVDLPASVVVKDGSGNRVAETDYIYDESAYLTAYTGTLPTGTHGVPPSTVRGNLTTVKRWLSTSNSFVTTHTNWYDTGEVYKQIDALGNTTTHSYDPVYDGAYSTKTCNALSQCVSGTYDFNTGLITSFTNANATTQASGNTAGDSAHTSSYSYDNMWRLITGQAPPDPANNSAQAQTTFTYSPANNFPLSVQRQHSITAGLTDSATTYFDALFRPNQTQHVTSGGTVTVNTTYDALGRASTVTNPFYSTSDPTYGTTQSQYDALGRVTQVTKQDGSISTVSYSDNCTTSTDEAGKQRRSCTDGLGRLIEVDEPGDTYTGSNAAGSFTINGSLKSQSGVGAHGGTQATGRVQIWSNNPSGGDTSIDDTSEPCPPFPRQCPQIWDMGSVSVTINGATVQTSYGQLDTTSSIASRLATAINGSGVSSLITASASGININLTAKNAGSAGNGISVSSSSSTFDAADFGWPSFGGTVIAMSGGTDSNPGVTVYDAGTVTATVGGFTASAPYSQSGNSTAAQVASALASALNASNSPVTASASGATISLTYKTIGAAGNTTASVAANSTQTQWSFSPPSFSSPGTTLAGGHNAEGASLDFNYFVTLYTYDALGNLLNVTQKGDPSVTTASQWRVRNFTYDSFSRLLTAANPESGTISYVYDANGNVLQKTSPAPNQTGTATQIICYSYDALNRVTSKAYSAQSCTSGQLPSGTVAAVSYTYDAGTNGIGHLTSLTDQAGSGSYSYDLLGRLSSETRVINGITKNLRYAYNLDGSIASVTYPSGSTVNYTPDSAGQVLSAVDTGHSINYVTGAAYGPDGQITDFISGQSPSFTGIVNSLSYNQRLQPVNIAAVSPSDPSPATSATASVTINGVLRNSSLAGPDAGTVSLTVGSFVATVCFGNSTNPACSGQPVNTTAAQVASNLASAINVAASPATATVNGATLSLVWKETGDVVDEVAPLATIHDQPTYFLSPSFTSAATSFTGGGDGTSPNILSINYDFHLGNGDNGNVWGITNNKDITRNQTFTYDALNRLTSAQNAGTDCSKATLNGRTKFWGNSYSYDAWGNLLSKTPTKCSAENFTLTAAVTNQLQGYSYDAAGNMTHDLTSGSNYTYDQENRITGAAGYTYTYDVDGNRVEKSNGTTGTLYWYMTPGIVAESDLAGNLQSEYVFFNGQRVARRDLSSGTVAYYFSDHLNTASVITDATGNIKSESDYYPWGGELQFANSDSNHYKFTGKERDSETGLDYFGARYYGNTLGRFITPDWAAKATAVPYTDFADPQSLNLYTYVRNIPTSKADPDGHCPQCIAIAIEIYEAITVGEVATAAGTGAAAGTVAGVATNNPSSLNVPVTEPGAYSLGVYLAHKYDPDFKATAINLQSQTKSGTPATAGQGTSAPLPKELVGTQDAKSAPQGNRHNSGPLDPSHGGVGDAAKDFDTLTGGKSGPAPAGSTYPPGTLVGDNGIALRPARGTSGPRIDIPANDTKPHETLHYPPPPPPPPPPKPKP
ncbi:MAG TPA: RHS repeat-associated core domain-containing protein [Candidatus Angelobacter sp.]|nr:RHS repeat-associated core domain-containing protein [Candidatus Angelobacter sp.]